jgi:hypothetical protein
MREKIKDILIAKCDCENYSDVVDLLISTLIESLPEGGKSDMTLGMSQKEFEYRQFIFVGRNEYRSEVINLLTK